MVFARLIIEEVDFGLNAFLVPMRDLETWKHLPGVKSGDIGHKIGYVSKDNGWASFDNVRIPRTNMMMGLVSLSKEGEMELTGDPRVLYIVMSFIRTQLVKLSSNYTAVATQISTRYCCVRRQFSTIQGSKDERKVADYQTTSFILAKLISNSLCNNVVAEWNLKAYYDMLGKVKNKDYSNLNSTHHILAGLKALITDKASEHIERARRVCGGAAYQSTSGFSTIFD